MAADKEVVTLEIRLEYTVDGIIEKVLALTWKELLPLVANLLLAFANIIGAFVIAAALLGYVLGIF